jgi:hypothetical protein
MELALGDLPCGAVDLMTALLETVASWPSLLLVIFVFGFAPGFCLRLIVMAYPLDDPRRRELIAELYAVPRILRPVWVAQQLEVALFEGVGHRVSAAIRRLRDRRRTRARHGVRVEKSRRRDSTVVRAHLRVTEPPAPSPVVFPGVL